MARIVVAGYIARFPLGGQAWAHLQYVLGLRALGHDVFYCEDAGWPNACYSPQGGTMSDDATYGVRMLGEWLDHLAPGVPWIFRDTKANCFGSDLRHVDCAIAQADILFNLSGVTWFAGFEHIPSRVFIDEDPAFTQVRAMREPEFASLLKTHQAHFTYGYHIGQPGCVIPTAGFDWRPLQQPIVLEQWPRQMDQPDTPFTTIMSWNAYGEVTEDGRLYGSKCRSFLPVLTLPGRTAQRLEIAVSGDEGPSSEELKAHGWEVTDPVLFSRTLDSYRAYIQRSRGEFSVAKHGYVESSSGWFSDRSAAYLASGRPVVLQDTGYSAWLPTGLGLIGWHNLEEVDEAFEKINADYKQHSRIARAIAEEYFDARRVLSDLLNQL